MNALALFLFHGLRFGLWLMLIVAVLLGLVRLVVWSIGGETLHHDVRQGPEVFAWTVRDANFGGLSALIMAPDGSTVLAAADHGHYIEAGLLRDDTGRITGTTPPVITQVSLASGRPPSTFKMDVEGLSRMPDGRIAQAFEGFVRIELLENPQARPTAIHRWDRFVALFGNQAFEALATLPDGRLMAISERQKPRGTAQVMLYDGKDWAAGPGLPVPNRFAVTGADVGPDGCLYVLDRRYGVASGFRARVHRMRYENGAWARDTLYVTPPASLGNVEGLSSWQDADGRVVLSLVTDNGFLPLTRTRLIELRLTPGEDCTLAF